MESKKDRIATLHSRGAFKVKAEKFEEFKVLVIESQVQIAEKIAENGPMSWDASFDADNNVIYIDSVFENQVALEFHQKNIKQIIQDAMPLFAEPSESVESEVFSFV
ncbi:MAG: hypothetical protein HRT57_07310 [Crocinitomicaceae bacterium]|nr:hypothetical protein [Crocinitomicaceae bacterium]